jgi:competence protein ComGC
MKRKTKQLQKHHRVFHHIWLIIIIFLILLLALVSTPLLKEQKDIAGQAVTVASPKPVCYDSDLGRYYLMQGKTLYQDTVYEDTCITLSQLREYDCVDGRFMSVDYNCKSVCVSGHCG